MSPPGMAARIDTRDVVEHAEGIDLWEVNLHQVSPGRFHGQVEVVQLNGLIFYREHWNQRILATGATPQGYFVFGGSTSSASGASADWCGDAVNRQQLALGRPASETEIIFPDQSMHIALLVPEHLMLNHFGEEQVAAVLSSKRHHLNCSPQHGCDLVTRLDHMVSKYQANSALLTDVRECYAAEAQLMNDLAGALGDLSPEARREQPGRRRQTLHRAIEFSEGLREPVTVPRYAAATGMSQRSLELAFQESLGISPRQYLRWHRMHNAHCELLAGDAESSTITGIAARWGFTELGRFSVEYKRLYGESPGATLKRRKTAPPKRLSDMLPG